MSGRWRCRRRRHSTAELGRVVIVVFVVVIVVVVEEFFGLVEGVGAGLAGTRLEAIATRAGISHPRVVQMFGSKQALFLAVVDATFDHITGAFNEASTRLIAGAGATPLIGLGDAYRRLLQRDRTVALMMLQSYAAAGEEAVRAAVARRHLALQRAVTDLTGADELDIRTFFATGLLVTISTALALSGKRTDAAWGAWLLEQAAHTVDKRS